MNTDVIYIIQEECLRAIKGEHRDYWIWCPLEATYGYTDDYEKAEKELEKLNSENERDDIRYVINEVERMV